MKELGKVGFGGGCHWCTEAVFSVLKGVEKVEQGWIKSTPPYDTFSEGVIVHYDNKIISLEELIEIHLSTHSSTSNHSMRAKYRSAIYVFNDTDRKLSEIILNSACISNEKNYITKVFSLKEFKVNHEQYLQYYTKNKNAPFCKNYIEPKLGLVKSKFPSNVSIIYDGKF
ncbi:peptide-methionine (S)-S-oxide reductase [Crocinitomix algicola]|uniref:peptide-methionine (S)-S-oxide reductase n=1 Tax=Crocinitomix algicola TaxID=1740263 RepID=UPI000871BB61|nr:peptide-methionine (S)-S-oxide reductase [Crocinitomix algicola]